MCSDDLCPAEIGSAGRGYAAQRMVNLMGAWHDQLIEVLGHGIARSAACGEVGRAIFMKTSRRSIRRRRRVPQSQYAHEHNQRQHTVRVRLQTPRRRRRPLARFTPRRTATATPWQVQVDRLLRASLRPVRRGLRVRRTRQARGYRFTLRPQDHLCIGPDCAENAYSCVAQCPQKTLSVRRNPSADCMGDPRWTSD